MHKSPVPHPRRTRTASDGHSPDIMQASDLAGALEAGIWPFLPVCATRALLTALLVIVVAGGLATFSHDAYAQSAEVLVSNGNPPPSARLLLVNVTQRQVAQEFTTGPNAAGYDVYAVAVRTENSNGKNEMGLMARIRNRRWEPVGPWNVMLPHRQVGPTLMRSRPISDFDWSWFTSPEPVHLDPNETYFFELVCRWGCFDITNGVGLGLTESNDEDESTLPGWSMADGFMIQNSRFNRWWGDLVVGNDGFFHPDPEGPVLRLAIRGEPRGLAGPNPGDSEVPKVSASDVQVREAPQARLAFPVTLSPASTRTVRVHYETVDGTATAGSDYVPASGHLVFAPGQTERTVDVVVLHDTRGEGAETLMLRLSGATGAQLGNAQATGTIINGDPQRREWSVNLDRTDIWSVAHTSSERLEGGQTYVPAGEPRLESLAVRALRRMLANSGANPLRADAKQALVGIWHSRFGAMPVPRVPPTTTADAGFVRKGALSSAPTP